MLEFLKKKFIGLYSNLVLLIKKILILSRGEQLNKKNENKYWLLNNLFIKLNFWKFKLFNFQ